MLTRDGARLNGSGKSPSQFCKRKLYEVGFVKTHWKARLLMQDDNWGWRARIGLFIVGNEAVPEAEWGAMAPRGVSVHAARGTANAPWARWRENRIGVDLTDDLLRGCRQFTAMRLSAVMLAHTSSSIVGGGGWDAAAVSSLSAALGAGVIVSTNGLDTLAALRVSG